MTGVSGRGEAWRFSVPRGFVRLPDQGGCRWLGAAHVHRYPKLLGSTLDAWALRYRRMTQLLEKALAEVEKLTDPDQDAIAAMILDELADERRWDQAFARSQEQLGRLADRVRQDIRAGRVRNAGIDEL